MASKGQETAQRVLALIVIVAMLRGMGIPLAIIAFFATVVYFVWRAVKRSEQQDIKNVFDFYISAGEVLRDDEKRWYGFEIETVIREGEGVLLMMSDPPPLVYYALGALYNRAGEHEAAVEHLSYVVEGEQGEERLRVSASPELRRYVQVLRRLEREPAEAPLTMAAMRALERQRRTRAAALLEESRAALKAVATPHLSAAPRDGSHGPNPVSAVSRHVAPSSAPNAPPPISEVLRDVWDEEEKKTA